MRLIDADTKLTVLMFDDGREEWFTEEMTVDDLISKFADETPPTINAIPVDWLIKWAAEHTEYGTITVEKIIEDWENDKANRKERNF